MKPDSTSNRRETYRVPPPGSPRLDAVKNPFQDTELVTHEYEAKQTEQEPELSIPDTTNTQPEESNVEEISETKETEKEL